jgi:predicted DNA-binding antitoxin AbrB/MazE fold protein
MAAPYGRGPAASAFARRVSVEQAVRILEDTSNCKVRGYYDDLSGKYTFEFQLLTDMGNLCQSARCDRALMESFRSGSSEYCRDLGAKVAVKMKTLYNEKQSAVIAERKLSGAASMKEVLDERYMKGVAEREALKARMTKSFEDIRTSRMPEGVFKPLKASTLKDIFLDEWGDKYEIEPERAEESMAALNAMAGKVEDEERVEGFTATERFDAIIATIGDVNVNLAVAPAMPETSEIAAAVNSVSGGTWEIGDGIQCAFETMIYHDKLKAVVVQMRDLEAMGGFVVRASDLEDIFPKLAERINEEVEAGGFFVNFAELHIASTTLVSGREAFSRSLSEAALKTVSVANAKRSATKKAVETDHYAANPLYGLL